MRCSTWTGNLKNSKSLDWIATQTCHLKSTSQFCLLTIWANDLWHTGVIQVPLTGLYHHLHNWRFQIAIHYSASKGAEIKWAVLSEDGISGLVTKTKAEMLPDIFSCHDYWSRTLYRIRGGNETHCKNLQFALCRSLSNHLNIQKAHSRIPLEKGEIISFQLSLPAYGTGYETPFMLLFLTFFIF